MGETLLRYDAVLSALRELKEKYAHKTLPVVTVEERVLSEAMKAIMRIQPEETLEDLLERLPQYTQIYRFESEDGTSTWVVRDEFPYKNIIYGDTPLQAALALKAKLNNQPSNENNRRI